VLLWSTIAVFIMTFTTPFLGGLSAAFGFVPISVPLMGAVIAIVIGYIVATEVAKAWFFQAEEPRGPRARR
jgi:Mg2+-importing ATPase